MQVPPESTNPAAVLHEVQEVADPVQVAHTVVSQSTQVTFPALSRDENFPSGQVIHFWIGGVVDSTDSIPLAAHVKQLVAVPLQVKHVGSHKAHAGNRYWVAVLLCKMLPSVAKYPVVGHLSTHVPSSCFRRYPVWHSAHLVLVVSPTAQKGAAIGLAVQPALMNLFSVGSAQTVQFLVCPSHLKQSGSQLLHWLLTITSPMLKIQVLQLPPEAEAVCVGSVQVVHLVEVDPTQVLQTALHFPHENAPKVPDLSR